MPELQQLHSGHAPAVLAFELANRSYFAAFVSDRGDEFFDRFAEQYSALLAEQEAGTSAYYVLVAEDGSVLGRFNLYRFADGTAELGYRVAQHAAGRGLATATVRELCQLAAARHGLRTLRAATSHENTASQKVLTKAGFVPVGPADPAHLGGKQGTWYQCDLAAADAPPPGINEIAASARTLTPETWVTHPLDLDIGEVADGYHLIARSISLSAVYLRFEFAFTPEPAKGAEVWLNMFYGADIPTNQDYMGIGDEVQYTRPPLEARYAWFDFFRPDYEWVVHLSPSGQPDSDYLRNRIARLTFDLRTGEARIGT